MFGFMLLARCADGGGARRIGMLILALVVFLVWPSVVRAQCVHYDRGEPGRIDGSLNTPGSARGLSVVGTYVYLADYDAFRIIDVSNPAAPSLVGVFTPSNSVINAAVELPYAYVCAQDGLWIVNVSNPAAPTPIARANTDGWIWSVAIAGGYAYVANGPSGLKVIDVSNPATPVIVGSIDTPDFAYGVAVAGPHAYVADGATGLIVVDISNPTAPAILGTADTPGFAAEVAVRGSYAFVADISAGLQVIDVSNPAAPAVLGSVDTPGNAWDVAVTLTHAYIPTQAPGSLQVIDVSNPAAPAIIGSVSPPSDAYGVAVAGDYAFVGAYDAGLLVITAQCEEPPATIGAAPASLDFGRTCLGQCQDLVVELYNAVPDPESELMITELATSAPFSLVDPPATPFTIAGGDPGPRVPVTVRYCPAAPGPEGGTLTITSTNATNSPLAVPLSGSGNRPPACDVGGPYTGNVGAAIAFNGTGSSDPDGGDLSYVWDFGDGATATSPTPSHTYATHGVFTVTLVVADDCGVATQCQTTADVNALPVCDAGGPYPGNVGQVIAFDGSASSDPDGAIVSYAWDFGDGNAGTGAMPSHTYATSGVFTVTLAVTDDRQAQVTCQTTADINAAPACNAGGPYAGVAGQPVLFDGTGSNDPDGTIITYDWNFGDGFTGTGATPTHTYANAGNYLVTLCVVDDDGAQSCCETQAAIGIPNQAPVCDAGGPYSGDAGQAIPFDGTGSSDPDGSIVLYEWDFGDGATATGATPSHTYTNPGTYTITLCVTDDDGAQSCCETTAEVLPPVAVELSRFQAATLDGEVTVTWETSLEQANSHFDVERASEGSDRFTRVNPAAIEARTGTTPGEYVYVDRDAEPGLTYDYRLVAVDRWGRAQRFGPIRVTVAHRVPKNLALEQNRPNPFNPSTTITFALPEPMGVTLRIYGADGHLVRALVDAVLPAQVHAVEWDGRDDLGRAVGSGVYVYRLEVGSAAIHHKMVLAR